MKVRIFRKYFILSFLYWELIWRKRNQQFLEWYVCYTKEKRNKKKSFLNHAMIQIYLLIAPLNIALNFLFNLLREILFLSRRFKWIYFKEFEFQCWHLLISISLFKFYAWDTFEEMKNLYTIWDVWFSLYR